MINDKLTDCGRCGSDACYKQDVSDKVTLGLCYGCGFQSNSLMKRGTEFFEEQFPLLPEIYKELMEEEEETGKIWMPTVINVPEIGMVFADGNERTNWRWAAVKSVEVTEDETEKYPIPGKNGEFYTRRMDMTTIKHFTEDNFMDALSYIGALPGD